MVKAIIFAIIEDILTFFEYYYIEGSRNIWRSFFDGIERIEKIFGVKMNLKHFFEPLYRDYSIPAYFFSFPWRTILILSGGLLLLLLFILYLVVWFILIFLPFIASFLIYHGTKI